MRTRTLAHRVLAASALALGVLVLTVTAASAHVTVAPGESPADGYTVLTFSVPHGCEESPTTQVKIQIPESIPQVTPSVNPGWDVDTVAAPLDEPVDTGEGEALTERDAEVIYTAKTPLPDGLRDSMELSLKMPADAGETLYFPIVQVCETGETAWIEIPEDGATEEPEHPAPAVVLTEAEGGHGAAPTDDADAEAEDAAAVDADVAADTSDGSDAAASDDSDDSSSNTLAIVAIVIGVAGLAVGGIALARSGKA